MVPSGIDKEKFCLQLERLEERKARSWQTIPAAFRVRQGNLKDMNYRVIMGGNS